MRLVGFVMAPFDNRSTSSSVRLTGAETGLQATSTTDTSDLMPSVKCVLVGDGAVGKTSLLVCYAASEYPSDYVPTAFDNYAGEKR